MNELIAFSLAAALAIVCIHILITWEGMILHWSEKYLARLPFWLRKPLYECATCMASVWGGILYLIWFRAIDWGVIWAILITAILATIIDLVLIVLCDVAEYFKKLTLEVEEETNRPREEEFEPCKIVHGSWKGATGFSRKIDENDSEFVFVGMSGDFDNNGNQIKIKTRNLMFT